MLHAVVVLCDTEILFGRISFWHAGSTWIPQVLQLSHTGVKAASNNLYI